MPERGSTHHSARVDEELHKETESLLRGAPIEACAEDWRRMEPPADGEPLPDSRVTVDDLELRTLLATSLRPSAFPGDRARLLAVAEEEHAEDRILEWLGSLPATRVYPNVEAVWEALGGAKEQRNAPIPESAPPSASASAPALRDDIVAEQEVAPAVQAAHVPQPEPAAPPEIDQSIIGRVRGLAMAGVELAVGIVLEAVLQVRRRL